MLVIRVSFSALPLVVFGLLIATTQTTLALTLTPVDQDRYFSQVWIDSPSIYVEATDFNDFNAYGHISSIEPQSLTGNLAAYGQAPSIVDFATENAVFSVDFSLDEDSIYTLTAQLDQRTVIFSVEGYAELGLSFFDPNVGAFVDIYREIITDEFGPDTLTVNESGGLVAGLYRLYARAEGIGRDHSALGLITSDAQVTFDFAVVVPEPIPALAPLGIALLLSLLGAMAYWRLRESVSAS